MQGPDLTRQLDKTSPRVTIIHHPDVRRMLMLQKAYAEGMRALVLYTAAQQDAVQLATASGAVDEAAAARNDLLLPVVKGVGSERAYEMLTLSLQTLGGSGFLQDYPIEQYIRDSKIDSLYEGTTGIQSLDFFYRKLVRDQGAAVRSLLGEIASFAAASDAAQRPSGDGRLKAERAALADGVAQVEAMLNAMTGFVIGSFERQEEAYKVGQQSVRLLLAFGDLIIGWLLARQAEVAGRALDNAPLDARRAARGRPRLLHRQARRGPVLRRHGAAPPGERQEDHRGDDQRPHGCPRGRVLTERVRLTPPGEPFSSGQNLNWTATRCAMIGAMVRLMMSRCAGSSR